MGLEKVLGSAIDEGAKREAYLRKEHILKSPKPPYLLSAGLIPGDFLGILYVLLIFAHTMPNVLLYLSLPKILLYKGLDSASDLGCYT
jgi:hypothetical protein